MVSVLCGSLSLALFVVAFGFLLLLFNESMNRPLMVVGLTVSLSLAYLLNRASKRLTPKLRPRLQKLPRR